jgi:hypothetical protein
MPIGLNLLELSYTIVDCTVHRRSWGGIGATVIQKQCDNGIVKALEEKLGKKSDNGS